MSQQLPRLLFVGAGNIAQSIMRGIIKAQPNSASQILATAPTYKNLDIVKNSLGCRVALLEKASICVADFKPDYVFVCVKPQVLMASISKPKEDLLVNLLRSPQLKSSTTLSLLAGIESRIFINEFDLNNSNIVRVMLNTAAEIGSTSVLYHADSTFNKAPGLEELFKLVGKVVIRINDEHLMDVACGVCGSGIAFFYEMIQTISDIGVLNGLGRTDATMIAAQLSKSAGEMLLTKKTHPYQLRDEVTSPAGTTIYGLRSWHEQSTSQKIGQAFQSSITRAISLSDDSKIRYKNLKYSHSD